MKQELLDYLNKDSVEGRCLLREFWENYPEKTENKISFPVGKAEDGLLFDDFADIKNIYIGGRAGTGKTTFIRSILLSLACEYSPEEVKFMICSGKSSEEYEEFNGLPHTVGNVCRELAEFIDAATKECEKRMGMLRSYGVQRVKDLNEALVADNKEPLPKIICIIDDYNPLRSSAEYDEINRKILYIAARNHAVGMYFIVASQGMETSLYRLASSKFNTVAAFSDYGDSFLPPSFKGTDREKLRCGEMLYQAHFGDLKTVRIPDWNHKEFVNIISALRRETE